MPMTISNLITCSSPRDQFRSLPETASFMCPNQGEPNCRSSSPDRPANPKSSILLNLGSPPQHHLSPATFECTQHGRKNRRVGGGDILTQLHCFALLSSK
ncbi:hypothetical protein M758_2G175400 [Ceratodon purpureus]|nr:hypothetical protein M758_2G175400 [Ceratodon purpureus]